MFPSIVLLSAVFLSSWADASKVEGVAFEPLKTASMDTSSATTKMLINTEKLGCFGDGRSRALRVHYFNARGYPTETRVQHCAEQAHKKGWTIFGVQWFGECWGDDEAEGRYAKYKASDKCSGGLGGSFANDVYRINLLCHAHGIKYKIGENMYVPNKYSGISEASCGMCKCGPDGPTGCYKLYCDLKLGGNSCEKWTDGPPPGQCCPNCLCVHNGALENEGSKWVVKSKDKCSKCVCRNGKAECDTKSVICPTCANPMYTKGKCCPICGPTTEPVHFFTIPPTTRPLIIPPRPPGFR